MAKSRKILPQPETVEKKTWLTITDLEVYIGIAEDIQREWRTKGTPQGGTIPYSKIGGNIRYKRTEVDRYLDKHKVQSA